MAITDFSTETKVSDQFAEKINEIKESKAAREAAYSTKYHDRYKEDGSYQGYKNCLHVILSAIEKKSAKINSPMAADVDLSIFGKDENDKDLLMLIECKHDNKSWVDKSEKSTEKPDYSTLPLCCGNTDFSSLKPVGVNSKTMLNDIPKNGLQLVICQETSTSGEQAGSIEPAPYLFDNKDGKIWADICRFLAMDMDRSWPSIAYHNETRPIIAYYQGFYIHQKYACTFSANLSEIYALYSRNSSSFMITHNPNNPKKIFFHAWKKMIANFSVINILPDGCGIISTSLGSGSISPFCSNSSNKYNLYLIKIEPASATPAAATPVSGSSVQTTTVPKKYPSLKPVASKLASATPAPAKISLDRAMPNALLKKAQKQEGSQG